MPADFDIDLIASFSAMPNSTPSKFGLIFPCIRYTTLEITSLGVFFKSSTKISVSSSRFVVPSILSKNCAISANFIIN